MTKTVFWHFWFPPFDSIGCNEAFARARVKDELIMRGLRVDATGSVVEGMSWMEHIGRFAAKEAGAKEAGRKTGSVHDGAHQRTAMPVRRPDDPHPAVTGNCYGVKECPLVWATFATKCTKQSNRLAAQVSKIGIPLAVLGYKHRFRGYGYRLRMYHSYLMTLPQDTIVILSDTYDVMLQPGCSSQELLHAYHAFNSSVVFSSEVYCWPFWPTPCPWWKFPTPPPPPKDRPPGVRESRFRYLNAGTVMGRAGALAEFIESSYVADCFDDQESYINAYIKRLESFKTSYTLAHNNTEPPSHIRMGIELDYYQDLFMSLQGMIMADLAIDERKGRIRSRNTGGEGCVLHQNGDKGQSRILEDLAELFDV
ncbi:Multifunctional procollagen lysine hydroxylase and glycosyltransferase LH3 [Borealophlyctis nickersoniae]|nr:Multifunctional procollagen lysine hydroxylase and glycosyltransferase LH3 [Borealophlyctis nickersoniae]